MTSITSINRVTGENTNASSLEYTVTFDSTVTGVDAGDFTLTPSGSSSGTIDLISGSGSVYTVLVNTVAGDGTGWT